MVPIWLHATQAPVQARLQQTPSAQKFDEHSCAQPQAAPSAFFGPVGSQGRASLVRASAEPGASAPPPSGTVTAPPEPPVSEPPLPPPPPRPPPAPAMPAAPPRPPRPPLPARPLSLPASTRGVNPLVSVVHALPSA